MMRNCALIRRTRTVLNATPVTRVATGLMGLGLKTHESPKHAHPSSRRDRQPARRTEKEPAGVAAPISASAGAERPPPWSMSGHLPKIQPIRAVVSSSAAAAIQTQQSARRWPAAIVHPPCPAFPSPSGETILEARNDRQPAHLGGPGALCTRYPQPPGPPGL